MLSRLRRNLALVAALAFLAAAPSLRAQAPIVEEPGYTPTLVFDVATIRQAPPPDANFHVAVSSSPKSSRFEATNLPIKGLLQIAYGFDAPVVGVPDWGTNTFYNIMARSDEAADARLAKLTPNEVRLEKRHALRALIAERLQFKSHLETRNSSIYVITLAKGGNKMDIVPMPPAPADGEAPRPLPPANVQAKGGQHGLEFIGTDSPMRAITGALSSMLEAPVVDRTGLLGTYNYDLRFGREWSANDPESYPSLFTAVQEQLGLKLESVKESVPNLIIDNISKPTHD